MSKLMVVLLTFALASSSVAASLRQLYRSGRRNYKKGKYEEALQDFNKAIELRKGVAKLYFARGLVFIKKRDFARASSDLDLVIKLKPTSARAYGYRAHCYEQLGAKERALQDCSIALALDEEEKIALSVREKLQKDLRKSPGQFVPTPGENFVNSVGMKFLWIEAGAYVMGSTNSQVQDFARDKLDGKRIKVIARKEGPLTTITIKKGYWLAACETNQREFKRLMGDNPSHFRADELPVDSVKWSVALEFCKRLTEKEKTEKSLPAGWLYTLPTEAQWEYACRANTSSPFSFGSVALPSRLNCAHPNQLKRMTVAVKSLPPNAWGLYEMHGNVSEWCLDQWQPNHRNRPTDGRIWGFIDSRWSHVTRGGSFSERAIYCRSASRRPGRAGFRNPVSRAARDLGQSSSFFARQGFRVVLTRQWKTGQK